LFNRASGWTTLGEEAHVPEERSEAARDAFVIMTLVHEQNHNIGVTALQVRASRRGEGMLEETGARRMRARGFPIIRREM
jgi:hypothetical protein